MKKVLLAGLIASALGASTSAFATNTATMAVSATIAGTCKIQSTTAMSFGTIDPSGLLDVTAPATVTYKCTKNTAPTTTTGLTAVGANDSGAQKRLLGPTPLNFMNYSISFTSPTTAGGGFGAGVTATSVAVTGTIAAADFQNALPETYTDTLTFTISP